jgi:glycosyltransferase involved in cell wall biosynthesis
MVITGISNNFLGDTLTRNLVDILLPISNTICVITGRLAATFGSNVRVTQLKGWEDKDSLARKLAKYFRSQISTCSQVLRSSKGTDLIIFYYGAQGHILPMLTAKILGKRILFLLTGRLSTVAKTTYQNSDFGIVRVCLPGIIRFAEEFNLRLADLIGVESPALVEAMELAHYGDKVVITGGRYVDKRFFSQNTKQRGNNIVVGYVGRLTAAKGILALAEAIPLILKEKDVTFLIVGDGLCADDLRRILMTSGCLDKVRLVDMVPHEKVGDYFSQMTLLVLPSFSEGLPGVVPEAMASGTPVLATPVGGIPDLIKHSETGFIMQDNSPRSIANSIMEALNSPKLELIARNALSMAEKKFGYEAAVERYRAVLYELG